MKKTSIFLLSCLISISAFAEIYRYVDSKGTVVYSDQPNPNAQVVTLQSMNIASQPIITTTNTNTTDTTNTGEKKVPYTLFEISQPLDQTTFQNATEIPVSVSVNPPLQKGDKIQFFMDGKPVSDQIASTSHSIPKIKETGEEVIERGTHSITATLYNEEGQVVKTTTQPVTVFAHYVTLFSPKGPNSTPAPAPTPAPTPAPPPTPTPKP